MLDKVKELIGEVTAFNATTKDEIETFRIKFLSKKGLLNDLFDEFKNVAPAERKEFGQALNTLKNLAQDKVNELKDILENSSEQKGFYGDLTRPEEPIELGSRHPISLVRNKIIDVFSRIGFTVSEGPEIEDDWHNFTALNLPEYHPARDMQDTFFIENGPPNAGAPFIRTESDIRKLQVPVIEDKAVLNTPFIFIHFKLIKLLASVITQAVILASGI